MAAPAKVHASKRRVLEVAAGLAVVALVFAYFLPKIADYGQVWSVVSTLSWPWILALLAASTLFILSDALPWLPVLPGLGFLNALRMDLAGSALSQVVPGGAAVNVATQYGMLRNWGFEGRPVVLAVSLTTLWSQFATFVFPVLAIALLSIDGGHDVTLRTVALAGLVIVAMLAGALVAVLWSPRMAKRLGDKTGRIATRLKAIVHKRPVQWDGDDLVRFRSDAIDLLRHRWAALTAATLANQLTVFLVLVVSLRALGITRSEVDVVEAFAAWSLVRALGSIPITPGGLGVQEVALSGALVGFGAHNAAAVAATLLYRSLTFLPSVVLGLAAAATYNLGEKYRPPAEKPAKTSLSFSRSKHVSDRDRNGTGQASRSRREGVKMPACPQRRDVTSRQEGSEDATRRGRWAHDQLRRPRGGRAASADPLHVGRPRLLRVPAPGLHRALQLHRARSSGLGRQR